MLICIEKNYHYRHHHHNTPGQHTWIVLPLGSQSKLSYPIIFQNSQAFSAFSIKKCYRERESVLGSTRRQHARQYSPPAPAQRGRLKDRTTGNQVGKQPQISW